MKVRNLLKLDPETTLSIKIGSETYPVRMVTEDEGVYDERHDVFQLLSENDLEEMESLYPGEDSLAFVSLVILQ